jgi:hypothetical protein
MKIQNGGMNFFEEKAMKRGGMRDQTRILWTS